MVATLMEVVTMNKAQQMCSASELNRKYISILMLHKNCKCILQRNYRANNTFKKLHHSEKKYTCI